MTEPAPTLSTPNPTAANLDPAEIERFSRLASQWWDPNGKFRPLHKIGPPRIQFVRDQICRRLGRKAEGLRPLAGLTLLDIGCGGGLVCEPMARMGAAVTGVDPATANIAAAMRHAEGQGLTIGYRAIEAEQLVAQGVTFDVVLCLEVVEHVPDPAAFLETCAALVRPGGVLVLSTINRTLKSYALAIVGAEYILRWLPVGTHRWDRFITPAELEAHVHNAGLRVWETSGLFYNPLRDTWSLGTDTDVNYLMSTAKPDRVATTAG
jgi:2-polyprenyl-6-hydroxyphenyl methylase / 3-demethylubiquinone-9 3-methyltransferase